MRVLGYLAETTVSWILIENIRSERNDQKRRTISHSRNSSGDWAKNIESRRSTTGHAILFRGVLVR